MTKISLYYDMLEMISDLSGELEFFDRFDDDPAVASSALWSDRLLEMIEEENARHSYDLFDKDAVDLFCACCGENEMGMTREAMKARSQRFNDASKAVLSRMGNCMRGTLAYQAAMKVELGYMTGEQADEWKDQMKALKA